MMESRISEMFSEAAQELNDADFELYRPIEDVVVFAVCANAQGAIRKMLTVFLAFEAQAENKPFSLNAKLEELGNLGTIKLFNQCRTRQKAFDSIDISPLECCKVAHNPDYLDYCLEVDKVKLCTQLGRTVEQTVRQFTGF